MTILFSKQDITTDKGLEPSALRRVRDGARTLPKGRYSDGRNLHLYVISPTSMSWVYRYKIGGKTKDIGLGSFIGNGARGNMLSLDEARAEAAKIRADLERKINPVLERKKARLGIPTSMSFGEVLNVWVGEWIKQQTALNIDKQVVALFDNHCKWLLSVDVAEITVGMVLRVLRPLRDRGEYKIAEHVRMRMSQVLAAAVGMELRDTNPASWVNLKGVLISKDGGVVAGQRNSMPYAQVPAFFAQLVDRAETDGNAMGLAWAILHATRTKEILLARVGEIDLDGAVWTIPAPHRKKVKCKGGMKAFPVPLSAFAVELIRPLVEGRKPTDFLFTSTPKKGKRIKGGKLDVEALRVTLERMGAVDQDGNTYDPHGFRATFKDYASDELHSPREDVEMALQHVVAGVEGDYRRETALKKRMPLMRDWAKHLTSHNVVELSAKRRAA
jgi:integrase